MISKINQKIYEAGGVVGLNYANNNQTVAMHNTYPDWPIYGSETASAVHSRGIYNVTGRDNTNLQMSEYDNDEAKVGWGHSASDAWSFVIKNDFNAGEFVWTGFDYLGEPTPWNLSLIHIYNFLLHQFVIMEEFISAVGLEYHLQF